MAPRVAALIVAAGRGSRFSKNDAGAPKQYCILGAKPVLSHAINAFLAHPLISHVLTVIHEDDGELYDAVLRSTTQSLHHKLLPSVAGGGTRQTSVANGLAALSAESVDQVLIHDAARPFITTSVIDGVMEKLAAGHKAVLPAVPVVDTLKRADEDGLVLETVDRSGLWAAQTPQGFDFKTIQAAHVQAAAAGRLDFTDDTAIAEWTGHKVMLSTGETDNFKITTRPDLERAERKISMTQNKDIKLSDLGDVRHGTGYDVHAFEDGDAVVLGGVSIPHDYKLKGHSDADVVLHALTDAILGAIGDGDIGAHFPPSDANWKNAASDQFLQDAIRRVTEMGGKVAHLDTTIVCESPKIGPHRHAMRESIAEICQLPLSRVSVKATTSERLGFTGRKEGIAALASATVRLPFDE